MKNSFVVCSHDKLIGSTNVEIKSLNSEVIKGDYKSVYLSCDMIKRCINKIITCAFVVNLQFDIHKIVCAKIIELRVQSLNM